jgi:hypothetical protein
MYGSVVTQERKASEDSKQKKLGTLKSSRGSICFSIVHEESHAMLDSLANCVAMIRTSPQTVVRLQPEQLEQ